MFTIGSVFAGGQFGQRKTLKGLRIVNDPPVLRHFTAQFEELLS